MPRTHHLACGCADAQEAGNCDAADDSSACASYASPALATAVTIAVCGNALPFLSGLCAGCADAAMQDVFNAEYVSLHVRVTNRAAKHLYTQSLGYL